MRLYNNRSMSKKDLMRQFRNGQAVYKGPNGSNYTIREIQKVTKASRTVARDRLLEYELGNISQEVLLTKATFEQRERRNRGSDEWKLLRNEELTEERKRMQKALHKIPRPAALEKKYIKPKGRVTGGSEPEYILNPWIRIGQTMSRD